MSQDEALARTRGIGFRVGFAITTSIASVLLSLASLAMRHLH
jgi:hypothetical protein